MEVSAICMRYLHVPARPSETFVQTGNTNDVTMQAGRQRAILPLIRKFNEHSERLLNSALGEVRPVKRRRLNVEEPVSTRCIGYYVSPSLM